jgi:hypothetical protein
MGDGITPSVTTGEGKGEGGSNHEITKEHEWVIHHQRVKNPDRPANA